MRVAGFGCRKGAGMDSLRAALEEAGGASGVDLLATVATKADVVGGLAKTLDLPVKIVPVDVLDAQPVLTQSAKSTRMFGTGSLSEAAALWAAGAGAKLIAARAISPDSMATCAIAERADT